MHRIKKKKGWREGDPQDDVKTNCSLPVLDTYRPFLGACIPVLDRGTEYTVASS